MSEEISRRAYEIWEAEGRPAGRHHAHWLQAEKELGITAPEPEAGDPVGIPGHGAAYPGMMGDGTEEQNLDQPGNPAARITEDEVKEAFGEGKD